MDIAHFKTVLEAKERELLAEIARLEGEARDSAGAEVGDVVDEATSSGNREMALEESRLARQTLIEVRDALRRMDEGAYGKCVDCGRPIEPARLEAVPWTPYCRADQERHDREAVQN
jgi:RNA polymerase-binding transcription factor